MSTWFNYEASLKILVFGLVLGSGLPALFALGVRAGAAGAGVEGSDGTAVGHKNPALTALSWALYSLALAGVWALGAFISGPLHLGGARWRGRNQRPVVSGTVIGLLLGGVFIVGGLIVREIPVVAELITRVLAYTEQGSWRLTMAVALLGAVAEELFYRGALYTALGRHHPLLISTLIYVIATLASGNPVLAFAAIILGTVCSLERRATGGVLAPILTHFVWTLVVLLSLPPLFGL